jgi:hypothetical protein
MSAAVPITLQQGIDSLHRIAYVDKSATSTKRLSVLATYCVQELAARGLVGVKAECDIPGGGRTKAWDVGWE